MERGKRKERARSWVGEREARERKREAEERRDLDEEDKERMLREPEWGRGGGVRRPEQRRGPRGREGCGAEHKG